MTKTPHNIGRSDHDQSREIPTTTAQRNHARHQLLVELFKSWASGGHKGTKPRKARIGQTEARAIQTRMRSQRDRIKQRMTKAMQKTRLSRNQNIRSGKKI